MIEARARPPRGESPAEAPLPSLAADAGGEDPPRAGNLRCALAVRGRNASGGRRTMIPGNCSLFNGLRNPLRTFRGPRRGMPRLPRSGGEFRGAMEDALPCGPPRPRAFLHWCVRRARRHAGNRPSLLACAGRAAPWAAATSPLRRRSQGPLYVPALAPASSRSFFEGAGRRRGREAFDRPWASGYLLS